jgi:predicted nucleic acid-binding protein
MPAVILDACGMINLYASGRFISILTALQREWYLPAAAERESQTYRQPDPADPEKLVLAQIDLSAAIDGGVLRRCDCESEQEIELYVELASRIGDDGESMGLAIAKCRGWSVLTDDKKARRIAKELGVPVLATTEVVKQWAVATSPGTKELSQVLQAIERFSNYRPGRGAVDHEWWVASLRPGDAE